MVCGGQTPQGTDSWFRTQTFPLASLSVLAAPLKCCKTLSCYPLPGLTSSAAYQCYILQPFPNLAALKILRRIYRRVGDPVNH